MRLTNRQVSNFQKYILEWWEAHRRDLPWRHTRDPYHILVSEVMLQQTQVSRVLPKYREFLRKFPTVESLVSAPVADVLITWKGMGYNRRALYLKQTAEIVFRQYKGMFPQDEKLLMKLPGLGIYTARALLVFAFEKDVVMVDTNIRQIITHYFFDGTEQKEKVIQDAAEQLLPPKKSWAWHQALMDYGALEMRVKSKERRVKKKNSGGNQVPFRETKRFFRGRVMDVLRGGEVEEQVLVRDFAQQYLREPEFIHAIISDLVRDGLVVKKFRGILSLPV